GVFDFVHKEASFSMRGDANGEPITTEVRVVDGTVYARTDGDWRSMPASLTDLSTPNPTSYLTYLRDVAPDVRVEGHEMLRGVETTRYGADIDFVRAVARVSSPAQRAKLAQATKVFGGMKFPTTVWIDGDGHLRKMQLSFSLALMFRTP